MAAAPVLPAPRPTSGRFFQQFRRDELAKMRAHIDRTLADLEQQFELIQGGSAAEPQEPQNDLGSILSPSQVNTYLGCSAKWWFRYGAGLPDPASASLVRGKVLHRVAEVYYRAKKAGNAPASSEDLAPAFEMAWEQESESAAFAADDDVDQLKKTTAILTRKYIDEAAVEIEPAEIEMAVKGVIGGVPVRGFVDLMDTSGRIIDVKAKGQTPSGVDPDYAFQLATYRQLAPGASGQVRLDVVVPNKTPKLVTIPYTVTVADQLMTQHLYPHVREGIREGLYFPNRTSTMCSRKYCNFADACEREFGGKVE